MEFDGLFSTRPNPYVLALTSRGRNPNFFKFDVERGYWIKEFFGDQYEVLLALLRIDGRAGQRLIPKNFLQQLNDCLPRQATVKAVPTESEIVILRPDLEQADRPYFDTWVYWDVNGKPSPTHENRTKTLEVLGAEALDYSDQMKASSKWSKTDCGRNWRDARKDD